MVRGGLRPIKPVLRPIHGTPYIDPRDGQLELRRDIFYGPGRLIRRDEPLEKNLRGRVYQRAACMVEIGPNDIAG